MRTLWLTGLLAVFSAVVATPAHALIQTVSPIGGGGFSTTGTNQNHTDIQFPGFSASSPSNLLGVRIKLTNASFTGRYSLSYVDPDDNDIPQTTITATIYGSPKFTFTSGIGSSTGDPQALTPGKTFVCPPSPSPYCTSGTVNLAPTPQAYTGMFAQLATATGALRTYFTGTPTVDISQTFYSKIQTPSSPDLGISASNLLLGGNIQLEYEYVPGPLPLLGAGAAFGWSRRLRRRITKVS
ncbi:MAG: hypothetical protein ACK587_02985 [Cyanobacteriota bacterium]|jgi:hypothetical protein